MMASRQRSRHGETEGDDRMDGYASVERTRAELSALLSSELISGQEQVAALAAAAATAWDETSGYGSVEVSRAASASRSAVPAPTPAPTLSDVSATTQTPHLFTVTGSGFTPGGRVYLTLYDQMSAQLYRTRSITASALVPVVAGPTGHEAALVRSGTFREAFANLCGETAMIRGYDLSTATWSTWLTVQPTCDGSDTLTPVG
jgi:hypothetical protein